ncbi:site-specific integrase [Clostridium algoriphilum]|uniref:site-specific integrase n=1 Tax=Clostridium algoriphilum TaxID=198347 RepID=UPI001CF3237E|nr:site-specific integrase [Clostridium algoriphilum]MCB2295726.1 site-specific integrase [Clostridium algoriphilum]
MNFVQPIRDKNKIKEIKALLLKNNYRDFILFTLGINTGFRISDILEIKVGDVRNKTHIAINEKKTDKLKKAYINSSLKEELDKYIFDMNDDDFLFRSREGENKPISRVRAYQLLTDVAKKVGLEEIGTHTLRKTFGYWHYRQHKDIALLQELFNHSAPSVTLRYIGINQDAMDESLENFYL